MYKIVPLIIFSLIISSTPMFNVTISNITNIGNGGQLFKSFGGLLSDTAQFRSIETTDGLSVSQTTSSLVLGFAPKKKIITTNFNETSLAITCTYSTSGAWNILLIPSYTDTIITDSVQSLTANVTLPAALTPSSDFYFPIPVFINSGYYICFAKIGADSTFSIVLSFGPEMWHSGNTISLFPCLIPWFV